MANVSNQSQNVKERAKDTAAGVAEKAKEVASSVADRAQETAQRAADKASQFASAVGDRAESAVESVGSGMRSFAGTIRENVPSSGMMGSAGESVAGALESGGRYLEEKGLAGLGEDMTELIRRNPIPSMLLAFGLGFLLASATRR